MNKFKETYDVNGFALEKFCDKRLNHIFFCASKRADDNEVFVISITLRTKDKFKVFWYPTQQEVLIDSGKGRGLINIPYFEPDFSNFDKLVKKIKTYLIFS